MAESASVPGFYGKLCFLGDFASRRLPRTFIGPLDDWLQVGIAASRTELGEDWLATYLGSPIWRFAFAPGVCGSSAWAGVMVPSVDRVGRYFPLTIATEVSAPGPSALAAGDQQWFRGAERVALATLGDDLGDIDAFDAAVGQLGACGQASIGTGSVPSDNVPASAPLGWQLPLQAEDAAGEQLCALLDALLEERFGAFGLWWTAGSELVEPSLLIFRGLPDAEAYTALLAGCRDEGSWLQWPRLSCVTPAQTLADAVMPEVADHEESRGDIAESLVPDVAGREEAGGDLLESLVPDVAGREESGDDPLESSVPDVAGREESGDDLLESSVPDLAAREESRGEGAESLAPGVADGGHLRDDLGDALVPSVEQYDEASEDPEEIGAEKDQAQESAR